MLTEKKVCIEVTVKYIDTASQDDVLCYFFLLIHQNLAPVFCTQIQLQSQKQAALFPENASLFLYESQEILLKDKTENNLLVIYERQFS